MQFLNILQAVQYHQYRMVSINLSQYEHLNLLWSDFYTTLLVRLMHKSSYFPEAILILDFLLLNLDGPLKGLSYDGYCMSAMVVRPPQTNRPWNCQTLSLEHHRDSYSVSNFLNHLICSWSTSCGQNFINLLKLERPINQSIFFE